ncbi:MAG: thiol protease/hemagglutinin PrtT [Paludibacteraceae bacterium]|nr:thiol protease/hemagglutinin PrtT [Paludibacteraceae bacterium]
MKKLFYLFLCLIVAANVFAERVSESDAAVVAGNFMGMQVKNGKIQLKRLKSSAQTDPREFYVFENEDGKGWVLIAADDRATPVLAYSKNGSFQLDMLPDNISEWLSIYDKEIKIARENKWEQEEGVALEWNNLKKSTALTAVEVVPALVATTWDQAPYYNRLCPADSYLTGNPYYGHAVTGCVATAVAQVMKYWEWPKKGTGYNSYSYTNQEYKNAGYNRNWPYGVISSDFSQVEFDWADMPLYLDQYSSNNQVNAVAELMFNCGVACNMMYGEESGATVSDAGTGLINYFSYSDAMLDGGYNFGWGYSPEDYSNLYYESEWKEILKKELDEKRPIIYSGGVHCFVMDGYDSNDYFHFNWGWSGVDDGFYSLNALRPTSSYGIGGGDYDFTNQQYALYNIRPNDPSADPAVNSKHYNLQMKSEIAISSDSLRYNADILTLQGEITNSGIDDFEGELMVSLYDKDSTNVWPINSIELEDNLLKSGESVLTDIIQFDLSGYKDIYPGTYYVQFYYIPTGYQAIPVGNDNYESRVKLTVYQKTDLQMMSELSMYTGSYFADDVATMYVQVKNISENDYTGAIRLVQNDSKGQQTILQEKTISLEDGNRIATGETAVIYFDVTWKTEGVFQLLIEYKDSNTGEWMLLGGDYPNPTSVEITVQPVPTVLPDAFEYNDTEDMAFNLGYSFKDDLTTINTQQVTIHSEDDVDYYVVNLKNDKYDYTINTVLYHAGTSKGYTVAATMSYKLDNGQWSRDYDSRMPQIKIEKNAELYIKIEPQKKGEIGTYQLIIQVSRKIHEEPMENNDALEDVSLNLNVYPNPATNYLYIDMPVVASIQVVDITGAVVLVTDSKKVDVSGLNAGNYIIRAVGEDEVRIGKFIKK